MNKYQVMGTLVCCTVVFAGLVVLLTMQGVHILLALLGVYLFAVWSMVCMQRKARENFEVMNNINKRGKNRESESSRAHARDFSEIR